MDFLGNRINSNSIKRVFLFLVIVLLSIREAQLLCKYVDFSIAATACEHLLDGYTHWRAFQNRILTPAIVEILNFVFYKGDGYQKALILFYLICIPLTNLLVVFILRKMNFIEKMLIFLIVNLGFVWCWGGFWYPWDNIDFICFLLLFSMVVEDIYLWKYWVLFLFWTLNKETAFFVPLFLFKFVYDRKIFIRRKIIYVLNAICMFLVLGCYTSYIRENLFHFSTLPGVGVDKFHSKFGNFVKFGLNIKSIFHLDHKNVLFIWLILLLYVLSLCFLMKHKDKLGNNFLFLWGGLTVYIIICFVSALIVEIRVFYPLVAMIPGLYISQNYLRVGCKYT